MTMIAQVTKKYPQSIEIIAGLFETETFVFESIFLAKLFIC